MRGIFPTNSPHSATVASIYKFAVHINEGENPTMPDPQCKSNTSSLINYI
jgi:hypothetical protein